MDFRLVPKSVTLNDLERRNGHVVCVISPNSVAFGADYVKVACRSSRYEISQKLRNFDCKSPRVSKPANDLV